MNFLELVKNLNESGDKIKQLQDEWPHVQKFIDLFNDLFGTKAEYIMAGNVDKFLSENGAIDEDKNSRSYKLCELLKQAGRPLSPKEIKKLACISKIVDGSKLDINRKVQGTLAYLIKTKKINRDENGKYFLNQRG